MMRAKTFQATNIVLGLLCLMYLLTYLDRVNISTAVASDQFLKEIPLTKTQAGLIFSAFAYPYLLFQIIGGWVADKFGPRLGLTVCGVLRASGTILPGRSQLSREWNRWRDRDAASGWGQYGPCERYV